MRTMLVEIADSRGPPARGGGACLHGGPSTLPAPETSEASAVYRCVEGCVRAVGQGRRPWPQLTQSSMSDSYLTVARSRGLLKGNAQTVRNWIDPGGLPAVRVGRRRVRVRKPTSIATWPQARTPANHVREPGFAEGRPSEMTDALDPRGALGAADDADLAQALRSFANAASRLAQALECKAGEKIQRPSASVVARKRCRCEAFARAAGLTPSRGRGAHPQPPRKGRSRRREGRRASGRSRPAAADLSCAADSPSGFCSRG